MNPRFHRFCCWTLALLSMVLTTANAHGMVVCIEYDGDVAIETPVGQVACSQRQEAAREQTAPQSEAGDSQPGGCVDIPLGFVGGWLIGRVNTVQVPPLATLAFVPPNISALSVAAPGAASVGLLCELPPPSSRLLALRSVVLLI